MRMIPMNALRFGAGVLTAALAFGLSAAEVSQVRDDEEAVLFPSLGWRAADGTGWEAEVHGCLYEPERRRLTLGALRAALGLGGVEMTEAQQRCFTERTRLLLRDHERGRRIVVDIAGRRFRLGRTADNGHFRGMVRLPASAVPAPAAGGLARAAVTVVLPRDDARVFRGELHLLDDTGTSVISDIDDTIKISEVTDRAALLRNTFLEPFRAVAETRDDFASWPAAARPAFHYVSASPWQLQQPLAEFIAAHGFPPGTFHLRLFRLKDRSILALLDDPEEWKLSVLDPLLRRYPRREFVLVGDSGERDPEVYATLARRFPAQVTRICIRDVGGATSDPARWQRVFAGLPPALWQVSPVIRTRLASTTN